MPAWRSDPNVNPSGAKAPVPSQQPSSSFQARDAREDPNSGVRPARSHQNLPARYRDPSPQQQSVAANSTGTFQANFSFQQDVKTNNTAESRSTEASPRRSSLRQCLLATHQCLLLVVSGQSYSGWFWVFQWKLSSVLQIATHQCLLASYQLLHINVSKTFQPPCTTLSNVLTQLIQVILMYP